ncbi:transcriptional regulator AhrC/ArgR [Virgibacillus halodenitrificans]|jgi:transcriptional regulator of arginine metabolism|uniref:Arginine repressor n=1 Tax=Virgibacillus halodenitrificans TaxID=1482 RepID=A0AAC9J2A7_VIRHA|nr:transcriptional regulator ArgR [Virgibacillus halodenitrificans]APC48344.1 arginine repressor [Virgibacillus halodenitrificans]MBD1222707.1 transcriptional regulator ArgR [Virgibacillus halodenitrificans]MCG1029876.1 transcriptional regulator ArgR [Virgibacillus halodenitrificans]MCJ0930909.1 transcriptional regulator ArgR [Virgibacillus halodenitrificans]MEC2158388.1 transcriptional regulator ArgR [Virgibacillus halodenitrificans]
MSKLQRHIKIRELITENEVETQDELVSDLKDLGFNVTQATVSRDIKELHLVKVPSTNGSYKYSLPADQRFNPLEKLKRLINDAFVKIEHASHFIILKTLPGNAQAVGALIDNLDWKEIMGTICGDDTCLIICRTEEKAEVIKERFIDML